jgi:hypothetical protein
MSYLGISEIAGNSTMRQRVAACAAAEGAVYPEQWAIDHALHWASAPGWDAAWASALASDPDSDPGRNEAAITDGMILAQVQAVMAADPGVPNQ